MTAPRLAIADLSVGASDSDRSFRLEINRLEIAAGEVAGIQGASGTGKTMLLEVLGLLRRPDPGSTFALTTPGGTVDLAAMWTKPGIRVAAPALRGRHYGFVPQSGGLLPFLSVADNISLSQKIAGRVDADWQADLETLLGIDRLRRLRPDALSIGQRQRVAVARALSHRPDIVIADEPTAALDPENAAGVMELLIRAARGGGAAVAISSHDLDLLDRFAMRRFRLELAPSQDPAHVVSQLTEMQGEQA
ncbi:ABC transporter ATP-binding protein [Chachezhania sediminis]|uniref:ABC transporter ATP-binding protein n=1 Tax=Chachezhania sediminis TaxID=2599291 RepID=UPI00131E9B5C|nr:ABC transporter ATP-binding protein [Chachezhania sediminis]